MNFLFSTAQTRHQGGVITLWCERHAKLMTLGKLENRFVTYWAD